MLLQDYAKSFSFWGASSPAPSLHAPPAWNPEYAVDFNHSTAYILAAAKSET